jgi:hypothetical protein
MQNVVLQLETAEKLKPGELVNQLGPVSPAMNRPPAHALEAGRLTARVASCRTTGSAGAAAADPLPLVELSARREPNRQAQRLRRACTGASASPPARPCWESHDLCLYCLDIAAELHAVLYLQSRRTVSLLNGQAEYATRVLPALADLMSTETRSGCQHHAPAANGVPLPARGGQA